MVTAPVAASLSACTVTCWAVLQLVVVNSSDARETVALEVSPLDTPTVTVSVGSVSRTTV